MRNAGMAALALGAAVAAGFDDVRADDAALLRLPAPVAESELARARGGESTGDAATNISTGVTLAGDLAANRLRAGMTGMNVISDEAFGRMQGLGTVIQNTGNQVLIQNSVILNLEVRR